MFITFEGGEGAGKTTQIALLKTHLESLGKDVVLTREPGGTPEAEKIRDLLVQREGGNWTPLAEIMLFFTARHMHVETKIKPALEQGKIVICDRFTDSTIAYQGYGHGFDLDKLMQIKDLSIGNFSPDMTFILDIPVNDGLARADQRMHDNGASTEDRFERIGTEFHERLRQGFLTTAKKDSQRCHIIDARGAIKDIHQQIIKKIGDI